MPAIQPHSTPTTDASWDGPAARTNLKNDGDAAYYRSAFAWVDPQGDPKTKSAYRFIHHMVSADGDVGAANLTACSTGIGVLNGARVGTTIPDDDRRGVWNHLARHLRDGKREPPELASYDEYLHNLSALKAEEATSEEAPALATEASLAWPLAMLAERPWAITPQGLRGLMRANSIELEALTGRIGTPLDKAANSGVEVHNGAALVNIRGPLFRYSSIYTWLLGGTSVEQLALNFNAAMDDPSVKRVVLAINSPGGQVDGIHEFANMIRARSREKPVMAYVDGLAASGAYWLAAAANRVVSDESSHLGSIGVLATVIDDRAAEERKGIKRYDTVSSQTPLKRSDPATDEGRAQVQAMVDSLAQLFMEKLAAFRGTTPAKVEQNFGRGGLLPARAAIAAGMADGLGSLEDVLRNGGRGMSAQSRGLAPMLDQNPNPEEEDEPDDNPDEEQQEGDEGDTPQEDEEESRAVPEYVPGQAAAPFDEQELEDANTQINETYNCPCPPGEQGSCECDDEGGESQGTRETPRVPRRGEGALIKPTAEQQRIAAILTCEEARGREALARMLALETNHTLDAARKLLRASPLKKPSGSAFAAVMGQIPNPQVGTASREQDDSAAAEVARILAFVPQNRKRPMVQ